jgi:hypothetical protein
MDKPLVIDEAVYTVKTVHDRPQLIVSCDRSEFDLAIDLEDLFNLFVEKLGG